MIAPLLALRDALARMREQTEARLAHLSPQARLWRRRLWRWARTLTAFGITLLVLGAAYFIFIASQGAVDADLEAPLAAAPQGGSRAVAEAARLLALAPDDLGSGALFLPDRHSRRVTLFQEGAVEAVGGFVPRPFSRGGRPLHGTSRNDDRKIVVSLTIEIKRNKGVWRMPWH